MHNSASLWEIFLKQIDVITLVVNNISHKVHYDQRTKKPEDNVDVFYNMTRGVDDLQNISNLDL